MRDRFGIDLYLEMAADMNPEYVNRLVLVIWPFLFAEVLKLSDLLRSKYLGFPTFSRA